MEMNEIYHGSLLAMAVMLLTVLCQSLVAAGVKASQPGAIPGKIDEGLGHHSFVFRAHRTFMNSLENVPLMLATLVLAWIAGTNPWWTAVLAWVYALARLAHMGLYYALTTDKNPSPRSYFFLLAVLAQWVLLGMVLFTLLF